MRVSRIVGSILLGSLLTAAVAMLLCGCTPTPKDHDPTRIQATGSTLDASPPINPRIGIPDTVGADEGTEPAATGGGTGTTMTPDAGPAMDAGADCNTILYDCQAP